MLSYIKINNVLQVLSNFFYFTESLRETNVIKLFTQHTLAVLKHSMYGNPLNKSQNKSEVTDLNKRFVVP